MDSGLSSFVGVLALILAVHAGSMEFAAIILFGGTALAGQIAGLEEVRGAVNRPASHRRRG